MTSVAQRVWNDLVACLTCASVYEWSIEWEIFPFIKITLTATWKLWYFYYWLFLASPIWQNGRSVMDMAKDKENKIIGLLNRQTAVANPNVSHREIIFIIYYIWQSYVENEDYPVAYFGRFAAFEGAYHWASAKGRARTCFIDTWISDVFMKHISPALSSTALCMQQCTRNTRQTQFLHRTATCSIISMQHMREHMVKKFRNWFFTQMLCHWTSIKRETHTYSVEVSICYVFTHVTATYIPNCNSSTCYSPGQKSVILSHI